MPDAPPNDPDALLEASQWDLYWLPADSRVVDRPELLYACSPRSVVGLNLVTRTRPRAPSDVERLVAEVSDAHRGVHSRWMVVPACHSPELEVALSGAGYSRAMHHFVYTIEPARYTPRAARPSLRVSTVDSLDMLRDWLTVFAHAFGQAMPPDDAYLAQELDACTRPGARVHRFVVYDDDRPVCSAGLSVYPSLSLGLLWAGGTVADARGRGAYSAVVAARIARARELGLAYVGLYARQDTSAPIVARQGFERHGWMTFWEREPRSADEDRPAAVTG